MAAISLKRFCILMERFGKLHALRIFFRIAPESLKAKLSFKECDALLSEAIKNWDYGYSDVCVFALVKMSNENFTSFKNCLAILKHAIALNMPGRLIKTENLEVICEIENNAKALLEAKYRNPDEWILAYNDLLTKGESESPLGRWVASHLMSLLEAEQKQE